jgi:hypothetical protein
MLQASTTPASALAITLDREPFALRSTRNHLRRAVRRGAAKTAERPSSRLAEQQAVPRWQVALPASRHGCQAPQALSARHGWVAQHARSVWWPGGADAVRGFVTVSASSASVRRPVSGTSVQCPRRLSARLLSSVRCGASERPRVRRPALSVRRPVSVRSRVRCVRPE